MLKSRFTAIIGGGAAVVIAVVVLILLVRENTQGLDGGPSFLAVSESEATISTSSVATTSSAEAPPKFQDYPELDIYEGPVQALDITSHPQAATYRTALSRALEIEGVDFAGHYTFLTIGCGTNCAEIAIIDSRTGQVYFPGVTSAFSAFYKLTSRLVIVNPEELGLPLSERTENQMPKYYLWNGSTLQLIYAQQK